MNREQSARYSLKDFDLTRYSGKWYEIARIENSFEKNMTDVTAEYTLDGDTLRVVNRGYKTGKKKWKDAKAVARLKYEDVPNILRVSFFRPFYADYIVLDYDRTGYSWALVRSSSMDYLWILSRTPVMKTDLCEKLLNIAVKDGFERERVIKISQEQNIGSDK